MQSLCSLCGSELAREWAHQLRITTLVRRWREVLVQPGLAQGAVSRTNEQAHLYRCHRIAVRVPVEGNAIALDVRDHQHIEILDLARRDRHHRLDAGAFGQALQTT